MSPERVGRRVSRVSPVWSGALLVGSGSGVPVGEEGGRDKARTQGAGPRDAAEGAGPGQAARATGPCDRRLCRTPCGEPGDG